MKKINEHATLSKKWWSQQSKEVIMYVNDLIDEFPCRMFQVKNGYIYLLIDHYKYIEYKRESKRVKLAKVNGEMKEGYYYITHYIYLSSRKK